MRKFIKSILRYGVSHIFLMTILFLFVFIIVSCIINIFGVTFRQSVYKVAFIIVVLGIIIRLYTINKT